MSCWLNRFWRNRDGNSTVEFAHRRATRMIAKARDVGNVVVKRRTDDGLVNVPYDVTFAFAFSAFVPDGRVCPK